MNDQTRLRLIALLNALEEGLLNESQQAELVELLKASDEAQHFYLRFQMLSAGLGEYAHEGGLPEQEQPGLPESMTIQYSAPSKGSQGAFMSAMSYLANHAFTPKRIATIASAAVLGFGLILTIVLLFSSDPTSESAQLPDLTPPAPTPDPYRVVATVTDQVNAQWITTNGQGVLPDRMLLAVNQRLTLTEGFAEVTTKRGAKVLVQAPAMIETTESDNAIRLHHGKLVGRCETPSSKGFIVHAPGMDVVDLGTVFGVTADEINGSTVVVMEGAVRAEPTETSPHAFAPVVLKQDDARRVVPGTGQLETITVAESPIFYEQAPHPYVQAVLNAKPLAYWRFEDDKSHRVVNEIDPGLYELQHQGTARINESDHHGRSARFDSTAEPFGAFFLGDVSLHEIGQTDLFTFECWFRVERPVQGSLLSLYEADPDEPKHIIYVELQPGEGFEPRKGSDWRFQSIRVAHCDPPNIDGSAGTNLLSDATYRLDTWHHVVVVKELDRLKVYLDGQLAGETQTNRDLADNARLSLGRVQKKEKPGFPLRELVRPMDGWIDEVAVYNRVLSEEEITAHWNAGNVQKSQLGDKSREKGEPPL
ncbi:MAG: LamG-like jellyroll fold domain-containing protein [Planctomycetota bacterium]